MPNDNSIHHQIREEIAEMIACCGDDPIVPQFVAEQIRSRSPKPESKKAEEE